MPRELETAPRPRCGSWVEKTGVLLAALAAQPAGTRGVRGFQLQALRRDHLKEVGSSGLGTCGPWPSPGAALSCAGGGTALHAPEPLEAQGRVLPVPRSSAGHVLRLSHLKGQGTRP